MNDSNSKSEKQKDQHQSSQEQYDMLKRCSEKKDITEWNQWRKDNPDEDICLEGRDFKGFWLKEVNFISETVWTQTDGTEINFTGKVCLEGAKFESAHLENAVFIKAHIERSCFWHAIAKNVAFHSAHLDDAKLGVANFESCNFSDAILKNASFTPSQLNGAKFTNSDLRGCSMRVCVVDGATRFWNCIVNRYSKKEQFTDYEGTPLNNLIVDPATRQLLEYNIRRMNWESWYKYKNWQDNEDERHIIIQKLMWFIRKFWQISDYGISTKGVIKTFFKWAFVFAIVYYAWGLIDYHLVGIKDHPGIVSNLFVLEDSKQAVSGWLVPLRAVYFSIVTMTTLGLGDMYASAHSLFRGIAGHILLALQVILGYVLLGALVTRFAVLFTAGGPAGKFADEKEKEDKK